MGLGYLAAALRKAGYRVVIYDLLVLRVTNERFVDYLVRSDEFDIIGVTALTFYYPAMRELCRAIKGRPELSHVPVIVGGVHVTALPELSLVETGADFAVLGEGEVTVVELLECLREGGNPREVRGIAFLDGDSFVQTDPRPLVENLDELPMPAWDLIRPELYPQMPHNFFFKEWPVFPVITSRGCPFPCTYCASRNFWGGIIRYRSVKSVVDEVEYLVKELGAKEIHLWDDNFTLRRKRVVEFCGEVARRGLRVPFACPNGVRVDTLDEGLLRLMRAAGFYSLTFAVESGSPVVQRIVRKNLKLEVVPGVIETAKRLGFLTRAFFIIGLPGETVTSLLETLKFALKLKIDTANFFFFTPLPGSTFFQEWCRDEDLVDKYWQFDFMINPQSIGPHRAVDLATLARFKKICYLKFYAFRPVKIYNFVSRMKFSQLVALVKRLVVVFLRG
ncbi:MAG: radical SAM protein [Promethearchaeota archaeon]